VRLPKIRYPEAERLAAMVTNMRTPEPVSPVVAGGLSPAEQYAVLDVTGHDVLLLATPPSEGLWVAG
jgi:ribulose 1,5-bisphosphate carboxylase large subunit-like protein